MEKSFDFGALLKNHEKKHKSKPTQFISVAGGVQKRLENNIKHRKSSRLSIFDSIRNLQRCESPAPLSDVQQKVEHRRQQLEKWKEEKEKKKKQAAAQKKKPFIAGVPHAPLKFVPPPPPPKVVPSTSGRITRSSTRNSTKIKVEVKDTKGTQSFAPKNASFRPPQNLAKAPKLILMKTKKDSKSNLITFDPAVPNNAQRYVKENSKETKAKSSKQSSVVSERMTRSKQNNARILNGKVTKPVAKQKNVTNPLQSSSSSEIEQPTVHKHVTNLLQRSSSSEIEQSAHKCVSNPLQSSTSTEIEPAVQSPILIVKSTRMSLPASHSSKKNKTPRKSVGTPKKFTPKRPVPKSESSSEEKLRSPKPAEVPMTPEQITEVAKKISPCVTMSRGKDNARREMKQKIEQGLLDEDASDMDSVDHFRQQLVSEIKRMTEMCDTWDKISEQNQLPDPVQECVLSAVGQARLLMRQKMAQFGALVERCARREAEGGGGGAPAALVTPADLHGFWDMVFMQVENVDMRFKKLEELRARGWVDEQPVEVKRKVAKAVVKKAAKPTGGPSRLREMIAAARQAKKQQEGQSSPEPVAPAFCVNDKTFEAGFFCVRSPVRSPATSATPGKSNLLKTVLSSEAKKASASKSSASFAMLRASVLGKDVECEGVAPLPQTPLNPINLEATPGRSILKSANIAIEKSGKKSIKIVLFDHSDGENIQNTSFEQNPDTGKSDIEPSVTESLDSDLEPKSPEEKVNLETELITDSGLSSMDIEKDVEKGKENSTRKSKLVRQDATAEWSPVMTRSMRKSMQTTPQVDPKESGEGKNSKRSGRKKKAMQEIEENNINKVTPKRSSRRRKSGLQGVIA